MSDDVVVIGGGIGGLSVAHHLVRAGVNRIHVYEADDRVGGKAKSQLVDTGHGTTYPGEHGFRFFPHFYRHVVDTMRTTPVEGGSAWDRLRASSEAGIAYDGQLLTVARPAGLKDNGKFVESVAGLLTARGIRLDDTLRYAGVLLKFATSCRARREREYDAQSWAEFAHADSFTTSFQDLVIRASRNLSAMRAPESSAATIGAISLQMIFDFEPLADHKMDPVLCGPTEEVWLQPWFRYLRSGGVTFHFGKRLTGFDFVPQSGQLRPVLFSAERVTGTSYFCALPLEQAAALFGDDMCQFDPTLSRVRELAPKARGDMVGLQFFLRRDVRIVNGHVHYPRTPFALTSISQGQFWTPAPDARPGTPELRGVLSVIISDWNTAGTEGLPASAYTDRDALLKEVWRQLSQTLPPGTLNDDDVIRSHLDDNVALDPFRNATPLLVHPVGQLALRPDAQTAIDNLYLASDYVRTNTDLATMEGADEAARRAVRAFLSRHEIPQDRAPFVQTFTEGPLFDGAKLFDQVLFRRGLPHVMDAPSELIEAAHLDDLEMPLQKAGHVRALLHRAITVRDRLPVLDLLSPERGHLERWEEILKRV
jgi:15-cis-phytoene desaturase